MTVLDENLTALASLAPAVARKLANIDPSPELSLEDSHSGVPTARLGSHYLHSRHDPVREAERIAERSRRNQADGYVIYGFGLGYLADAIIRQRGEEPVIIVERDPRLLRAALEARRLTTLFGSPRVRLQLGPSPREFASLLTTLNLRFPLAFGLRSVTEGDEAYYRSLEESRKRYVSRQEVNSNTLQRFGRRWIRNLVANVHLLARARGVRELGEAFAGTPVLLCAGGPSLDLVLPLARRIQERAVIVAVDTAVKPLLTAGVEPDFIVIVDPQYWNTRHLDNIELRHAVVIGESSTHPRAFRILPRPLFFCSSLFPLGQYLEQSRGSFGALGAGGSVTTTAWDFARHIGGRPIYAAGLDLGYPHYRTHVTGSLFEERSHLISNRLSPAESLQVAYIENGSPFPTEANDGGEVLTDQRMTIYRDWFGLQDHGAEGGRSFNLSPHGVAIPGMPAVPVDAVLAHESARERIDSRLHEHIGEPGSDHEASSRIHAALARLSGDLERAAALGHEALDALARRERAFPEPPRSLDAIEDELRSLESKDIIGFLLESVLRDLNESRPEHIEDAMENSRRVYQAIHDSAQFHAEMLQYALRVLQRA
ncbi:MAG: DUF115 domain-containing protein [Spirochaetes bacterium]|jgi:hypothetical protein|nr:DUF115 domain-containing protein [Spirochaetota bacterium]